jgi:hypothetical protein
MKLQTQIPLEKQTDNQIDYQSKILLLGSCFVENIGNKLEYFKFQSLQNPFGILFHPKAIERLIYNAFHKKTYSEEDIFFHNEQWHCYDAHSKLSNPSKDQLLKSLNRNLDITAQQLQNSSHIVITLGTAWVYKHHKSNLPVANCHKVPQKEFKKELLSVEEVIDSLKLMVSQIHHINPNATIIFTVSPVRHIKDGFIENSQSKAHLITAIHNFLSHRRSRDIQEMYFYFPSYEIMLDELRDYRFYAEDMLHPNKTAVNYIWEKFQYVWLSNESQEIMNEVEIVQNGMAHRPFNPNSDAHQKFLQQLESKKQHLQIKFPNITFFDVENSI